MDFKVYVLIEIPILEKECELFVPADRRIHEIISVVKKNIPELSKGYYKDHNPKLINKTTGKEYDLNEFVKNTNIKMGTRLLIV